MTCPVCNSDVDQKYRPFCSRRCADIDLAKWMNGGYAIPSQDPDDIEAALDAVASEAKDNEPKPH
ncbi:MAG: DNA gyrase inhibitor YacG [Paracoccaceae bacterium]